MQTVVHRSGWIVAIFLVLGALGFGASYGVAARNDPGLGTDSTLPSQVSAATVTMIAALYPPQIDLAKVQGSDACGECHTAEIEAWKHSTHSKTFDAMHKLKDEDNEFRARKIVNALGLKGSIKRNDLCFNCHYTVRIVNEKRKAVSGVSCESCHGPAADWIDVHYDYGADKTKETETAEHRDMRLKKCVASGMLRPTNVYLVAQNCYSCHSVPNEKLVNVGGHKAGSAFELVSWSQGEVRHNYFYSADQSNRAASAERKRILFVVGAITDLEFAIRGMSKITEKGAYQKAMLRRKNTATARLDAILKAYSISELQAVLSSAERDEKGRIKVTSSMLATFPDQLSAVASAVATKYDGCEWAAIDPLIPGPDKYHGPAQP